MRTLLLTALTISAFAVLTPPVSGQTIKSTTFGLKGGFMMPGTVYTDFGELDSDIGFSLGGFADHTLSEKLYGSAGVDLHSINIGGESEIMLELNLGLKANVSSPAASLAVRPGFSVGYATVTGNEFTDGTQFFIIRGFTELVARRTGSVNYLGEIGIGYATGGNSDVGVDVGPMLLLRGGLQFN